MKFELDLMQAVTAVVALLFGGGGVVSGYSAWNARRQGVASDEREARRDTITDRDALIDRLEKRLESVEARLTAAEDGNVAKAVTIRTQGDHIDVLEDHIWQRLPPPPPPRPAGA